MDRLNQDRHEFFALSSVSVVGPELQFAAPFLAVRRSQVIATQAIDENTSLESEVEREMATTC